jgi:hypothetical protein
MVWHVVVGFRRYEMKHDGEMRLRRGHHGESLKPTNMGTISLAPDDGGPRVLRNVNELHRLTFPPYDGEPTHPLLAKGERIG